MSASFVEAAPEAGPSGAVFGVLGLMLAEVHRARSILRRPWRAAGTLLLVLLLFVLIGLFPWVDNFAHLAGFLVIYYFTTTN